MRWHFECPDCGYDDQEYGRLAEDREIWCGLCATDGGKERRLVRWSEGTKRPQIKEFEEGYDA